MEPVELVNSAGWPEEDHLIDEYELFGLTFELFDVFERVREGAKFVDKIKHLKERFTTALDKRANELKQGLKRPPIIKLRDKLSFVLGLCSPLSHTQRAQGIWQAYLHLSISPSHLSITHCSHSPLLSYATLENGIDFCISIWFIHNLKQGLLMLPALHSLWASSHQLCHCFSLSKHSFC